MGTGCKGRKFVGFVPYSIPHAWEELHGMDVEQVVTARQLAFLLLLSHGSFTPGTLSSVLNAVAYAKSRLPGAPCQDALALEICWLQPLFLQAKCESTSGNILRAS